MTISCNQDNFVARRREIWLWNCVDDYKRENFFGNVALLRPDSARFWNDCQVIITMCRSS